MDSTSNRSSLGPFTSVHCGTCPESAGTGSYRRPRNERCFLVYERRRPGREAFSERRSLSARYSALMADIGVTRTALIAGMSEPASVIRSARPTAPVKVAGSPGSTPKSKARIPRAAA